MENKPSTHIAEFLKNLSVPSLNEMQERVIKMADETQNLMLLAPTGSGKTLAYLIPLINALNPKVMGVQALIVAPSRELSLQIEQVFKSMRTTHKVSCCYGGHSVKIEQNSLKEAPAVIIGTPGRLADHIYRNSFDPESIKLVVLDEFDKSLQLGFHEQLKTIFKALDGKQRHLLTSATKLALWPDFLPFSKPEILDFLKDGADSKLKLHLVHTSSKEKVETLVHLVAGFKDGLCLVFCNHRDAVDRISNLLSSNKIEHSILHGGMEQIEREKNLIKFRGGATNLLIATDLASRGLDIPEIRHIVHYQLPSKKEAFTHRNGRTARMHAEGQAYLVLSDEENLPDYLDVNENIEEIKVSQDLKSPAPPFYECLYISAGKKDKISKGDIVGLLTQKGGLKADEIGLINLLDFAAYVSVKRGLVEKLLVNLKDEKLKKLKIKMELAN